MEGGSSTCGSACEPTASTNDGLVVRAQFRKHLSLYYSLFASLILVTNPKIREVLKETFERIGALHGNFATAE